MKKLLFAACAVLAASAEAQVVEVACPKFYPWEDTVLAEVPYKHKGKGVVKKRELRNAGAYWGDFNGIMQIAPADVKKVKGGRTVISCHRHGLSATTVTISLGGRRSSWTRARSRAA